MVPIEERSRPIQLGELGDRLRKLRLRRPAADERMRRSLEQRGQLTAVTAFDDGDRLQLIDGFKRLAGAERLGWASLQVRVLAIDEAVATAAVVALHEQGGLTELEEGWVVRSLHREHGLSQGAVAALMARHKSWVSRRLLLVEGLDEAVQGDVRLGLLSPRSAIAVAALPRGNQRQAAELVMQRGLTTRQAESLVRRLRQEESDEARAALLEGYVEARGHWPEVDVAKPHVRPRSEAEQLMADVATLMRVGVRVEVRLLDAPVCVEGAEAAREALAELSALLATLGMAIGRALKLQLQVERMDETLAHP
jgi:ParB-like chromosome segregation protein Spo0J